MSFGNTYIVDSLLRVLWLRELYEAVAAAGVVVTDGNSGTENRAETLEVIVQVLVRPLCGQVLDEHIGAALAIAQELLVVGEGTASLAVELGELDVLEELARLHDVGEAAEGVVEILETRSLENHFAIANLLLEELVQLDQGKFLGQVADEDGLRSAGHLAGSAALALGGEALLKLALLEKQVKSVD